jgi:hypothetical protein
MPNAQLVADYRTAMRRREAARDDLLPLVRRMAIETLSDVLAGATTIEAHGELDEDWNPTLRIQRVLDVEGRVLFDVELGHPDRVVEDAVDLVDVEYLDALIDLTGDEYMGHVVIV